LAGEIDLEVGVNPLRVDFGLREMGVDLNQREFRAARGFNHVQIAIGVAGVEGFDRDGDEKVAHAALTDTLAPGVMTHAVNLMHGMGHVIRERGLIQNPLRCCLGEGELLEENRGNSEQNRAGRISVHGFSQNLR
jgi:hypothetical protein